MIIFDAVVAFGEDVTSSLADVSDRSFGSILTRQGLYFGGGYSWT